MPRNHELMFFQPRIGQHYQEGFGGYRTLVLGVKHHCTLWRPSYSYSAIVAQAKDGSKSFIGLAIKEGSEYCFFDDEQNYNSQIFEWGNYYWIASALFENGVKNPVELDEILASIPSLPDFSNITNQNYAQIIKREYYNNQDLGYYEPTRRYGQHNYPTDKGGGDLFYSYDRYLRIMRFNGTNKGQVIGNFPNDVLVIGEYKANLESTNSYW